MSATYETPYIVDKYETPYMVEEIKEEKKIDIMIEEIEDLLEDLNTGDNVLKDYQYNPKINQMLTRRFDNGLFIDYDLKNDTMEVYEYINNKKYIVKEHDDDERALYHKPDGNDDYLIVLNVDEYDEYYSKVLKLHDLIDDSNIFDCDDYLLYETDGRILFNLD